MFATGALSGTEPSKRLAFIIWYQLLRFFKKIQKLVLNALCAIESDSRLIARFYGEWLPLKAEVQQAPPLARSQQHRIDSLLNHRSAD